MSFFISHCKFFSLIFNIPLKYEIVVSGQPYCHMSTQKSLTRKLETKNNYFRF